MIISCRIINDLEKSTQGTPAYRYMIGKHNLIALRVFSFKLHTLVFLYRSLHVEIE